ncbi:hypothetical protein LZC95_31025 [Pendulispora brunnea]|uniref:Cytochrome C Planctomycete-type domain-containing protein n=1 Tax=Pendulispora brunnea TaxID=2905690 RepID=A0ABZ2K1D0_9BACT
MLRFSFAGAFVALAASLAVVVVACSGGDDSPAGPSCVQGLKLDCTPLYDPPDYPTLFEKTFKKTCASGVGTCHTSDAAKGGLVFEDADTAYAQLLGTAPGAAGRKRVIPRDPACSLLVEKLESTEPSVRMPPSSSGLPAAERCAIERWIANGAAR